MYVKILATSQRTVAKAIEKEKTINPWLEAAGLYRVSSYNTIATIEEGERENSRQESYISLRHSRDEAKTIRRDVLF